MFSMYIAHTFLVQLFWLIVGHALADFPLQGDFLSHVKNPNHPLAEKVGRSVWKLALPLHGMIHAGAVAFITGSYLLAAVEWVIHCAIDYAKCQNRISFTTDQVLHLTCKVIYAAIIAVAIVYHRHLF